MRYYTCLLYCACAFGQVSNAPQSLPPNKKPDAKCSIEGVVRNSVTGEPVKRARVLLTAGSGSSSTQFGTTTDASGHYLINEVDSGSYQLGAFRDGYSPQRLKDTRRFTLEAGQDLKEVDLKIVPVSVISGRILDEDGEPVNNAKVECMRYQYANGTRQLVSGGQAATNDLGEFRLSVSTAGKYVIRATPPAIEGLGVNERPILQKKEQRAERDYVPTYFPQTATAGSASSIELTPGSQRGMNITLMRAPVVHISGRIKADTSRNLEFMSIQLSGWDIEHRYAETDLKGRFRFDSVFPGSYYLHAVAEKGHGVRVPIDVGDQNIEGIELTLLPPVTIQGRVVFEDKGELKGKVPALTLMSGDGMDGRWVRVEDDLTFKADGLTPGTYGFGLGRGLPNKRVRLGDQNVPRRAFDLMSGVQEITVYLNPDAGIVEGSVKNAKDEPASGSFVTLITNESVPPGFTRLRSGATDQNGKFVITGVPPGEYKIYAWEEIEDGAYEDPDFLKLHESEARKVSIEEKSHELVELKLISAESTSGSSVQK